MSLTTRIVAGATATVALVATPGVVATGLKAARAQSTGTVAASEGGDAGAGSATGEATGRRRHAPGYGSGATSGQAEQLGLPGQPAQTGPQPGEAGQGQGDQQAAQGQVGQQGGQGRAASSTLRRAADGSLLSGTRVGGVAGVVLVDTTLPGGRGEGTGMTLTADGEVLTNYHVVQGSTAVSVTDSTTGRRYAATVVGHDATHDVAVLRLKGATNLRTVTLSQQGAHLGEEVAAIGQGGGQGRLYRVSGTVSGVDRSIDAGEEATGVASTTEKLTGLVQTTADVVPGYSGGPLVDAAGAVVAMDTAASQGDDIDGFAVPISQAKAIADQIVGGTRSATVHVGPRGALGVSVAAASRGGATVARSLPGSAAARAGITTGSTITALDGRAVGSASALSAMVGEDYPGTRVTVTWTDPAGSTHRAPVVLGTSTAA